MINNLKCYERMIREKDKKTRKRANYKVMLASLALGVTLVLTGCGPNEYQQRILDAGNGVSNQTQTQVQYNQTSPEIGISDLNNIDLVFYNQLLEQQVSFSDINTMSVYSVVEDVNPIYPYTDISNVNLAYERYQQIPTAITFNINQKIINGELTAQELFNMVKANNAAYREQNRYSIHVELDDNYIMSVCEIICDTLKKEIPKLQYSDNYDDISYNIMNLCIFKSATFVNAQVTDDNCLIVSPNQIENMKTINDCEQAPEMIISHEAEHLIQKIANNSREQLGTTRAYGFNFAFENLDVNSMYYNWFIEASSEQLTSEMYGLPPLVYEPKIGYLNSLILVTDFNDNLSANYIPRLSQQSDINRLFDAFGCNTNEEKIELLNMMYAIEVVQEEPEDFFNIYESRLGREVTENELIQIKIDLKNSLCQTLTKYFYKKFSTTLSSKEVSVEQIFKLISLFEADLNMHISYKDDARFDSIKEFMEEYLNIQNEFFEQLSQQLGVSIEDIINSYDYFNENIELPRVSLFKSEIEPVYINVSIFDAEKNEYIETIFNTVSTKKTVSISQKYEELTKNNQK